VSIYFNASDASSTISFVTPAITLSAEGANQTAQGIAIDNAGNNATVLISGINIDKTRPLVSGLPSRLPDTSGWYNHTILISWSGNDSLSGIASCDPSSNYPGPDGAPVIVHGQCIDRAGNTATGSFSFNYDSTPSTITSPQQGQNFTLRQAGIAPVFKCNDVTSGIASCVASVSTLDTSTVGVHSYNVTATDNAGNVAKRTITYNVHYTFGGFVAPLTSGGSYNSARTIPVQFQLFDSGNHLIRNANATIFVDNLNNPGISSGKSNFGNYFRYDATSNDYTFNLSLGTMKLAKGNHSIIAKLDDGTMESIGIVDT
jgi:hypothetical protein